MDKLSRASLVPSLANWRGYKGLGIVYTAVRAGRHDDPVSAPLPSISEMALRELFFLSPSEVPADADTSEFLPQTDEIRALKLPSDAVGIGNVARILQNCLLVSMSESAERLEGLIRDRAAAFKGLQRELPRKVQDPEAEFDRRLNKLRDYVHQLNEDQKLTRSFAKVFREEVDVLLQVWWAQLEESAPSIVHARPDNEPSWTYWQTIRQFLYDIRGGIGVVPTKQIVSQYVLPLTQATWGDHTAELAMGVTDALQRCLHAYAAEDDVFGQYPRMIEMVQRTISDAVGVAYSEMAMHLGKQLQLLSRSYHREAALINLSEATRKEVRSPIQKKITAVLLSDAHDKLARLRSLVPPGWFASDLQNPAPAELQAYETCLQALFRLTPPPGSPSSADNASAPVRQQLMGSVFQTLISTDGVRDMIMLHSDWHNAKESLLQIVPRAITELLVNSTLLVLDVSRSVQQVAVPEPWQKLLQSTSTDHRREQGGFKFMLRELMDAEGEDFASTMVPPGDVAERHECIEDILRNLNAAQAAMRTIRRLKGSQSRRRA